MQLDAQEGVDVEAGRNESVVNTDRDSRSLHRLEQAP